MTYRGLFPRCALPSERPIRKKNAGRFGTKWEPSRVQNGSDPLPVAILPTDSKSGVRNDAARPDEPAWIAKVLDFVTARRVAPWIARLPGAIRGSTPFGRTRASLC